MKVLSKNENKAVTGAVAIMSGGFSMSAEGMSFSEGFYINVTKNSSNIIGTFAAFSNKVVNLATNTVLFDGAQDAFCMNGSSFSVHEVTDGHKYIYTGKC
jgi:hypothetical protein